MVSSSPPPVASGTWSTWSSSVKVNTSSGVPSTVSAPAVCTSVNTVRAPATPFTCVGLMTSNTMLTFCENRPVATLSIAALSDTFTGSSAPDATRPADLRAREGRHRGRRVAVGDARRQARQLVLVDVDVHRRRVLTRHVVLDRDRRAGVNDDAVAVKVGRHKHRGQAQEDGLIVPAAGRQRHMVDLVEQREGEHVVRRAQHRVGARRLHQREHRAGTRHAVHLRRADRRQTRC